MTRKWRRAWRRKDRAMAAATPARISSSNGSGNSGILLAVVVVIVVAAPMMIGSADAITEAISELISPVGLLLLPIVLLLAIQFLSSDRGSFLSVFSSGEPDSIHRASGSPVGIALVLFLVCNRFSIFGGDDDSDD